jgi:hypothetical protein
MAETVTSCDRVTKWINHLDPSAIDNLEEIPPPDSLDELVARAVARGDLIVVGIIADELPGGHLQYEDITAPRAMEQAGPALHHR